jgi:soluble lytic murein transglycosylase-like protein
MAKLIAFQQQSRQRSRAVSLAPSLSSVFALLVSVVALALSMKARHEPLLPPEPAPVAVAPLVSEPPAAVAAASTPEQARVRAMADYLGKRYFVSTDAIHSLVEMAFSVGREVNLDPLLILAVMAVESRFNPIAESVAGAQGLMQVIPKYHVDKVPETHAEVSFLDPGVNVLVGARVLKEYIGRSGGNLQSGLQMYNGAPSDTGAQYANKVIAEKDRLRQVFSTRGRSGT